MLVRLVEVARPSRLEGGVASSVLVKLVESAQSLVSEDGAVSTVLVGLAERAQSLGSEGGPGIPRGSRIGGGVPFLGIGRQYKAWWRGAGPRAWKAGNVPCVSWVGRGGSTLGILGRDGVTCVGPLGRGG